MSEMRRKSWGPFPRLGAATALTVVTWACGPAQGPAVFTTDPGRTCCRSCPGGPGCRRALQHAGASISVFDHERRRRHRDLTTRAAPDCHPDGVVGLIGEDCALVAVATGILDLADQAPARAVGKKARCAVRAPCFDEQLSAAGRCRVGVALGDDDDVGLWSAAGCRRSAAFRCGGDAGTRQRGRGSRAGTGDGCGALWCSPASSARAEQ